MIKNKLLDKEPEIKSIKKACIVLTTISKEIRIKHRDFLRQIIRYDKIYGWMKDNYKVPNEYKKLVEKIIQSFDTNSN